MTIPISVISSNFFISAGKFTTPNGLALRPCDVLPIDRSKLGKDLGVSGDDGAAEFFRCQVMRTRHESARFRASSLEKLIQPLPSISTALSESHFL
jgi:hypothetical protein